MNPLPAIQNACAIIDKSLGKYADEAKREVAWGLVRDLCEKWRPVTPVADAAVLADAVAPECPAPAEYAPANSAMHAAIAEHVATQIKADAEASLNATAVNRAFPATATVKIQGMCPNPRLMAGTLADGRKVSVWTCRGRQFRIYADVACKLDVVRGDEAIYLPL